MPRTLKELLSKYLLTKESDNIYLEPAARILVRAVEHRNRALFLQVRLQILLGEHVDVTTIRASHRHPPTLQVVRGKRVGDELLSAKSARKQAFGALAHFVVAQVSARHLDAALVFAV